MRNVGSTGSWVHRVGMSAPCIQTEERAAEARRRSERRSVRRRSSIFLDNSRARHTEAERPALGLNFGTSIPHILTDIGVIVLLVEEKPPYIRHVRRRFSIFTSLGVGF